jgi:hypothetical protein
MTSMPDNETVIYCNHCIICSDYNPYSFHSNKESGDAGAACQTVQPLRIVEVRQPVYPSSIRGKCEADIRKATEAAFPLRHPYLEASIERAQGCLDLVDSRCVMQVE